MINILQRFYDDNILSAEQEHFCLKLIEALGGKIHW